MQKYCLILDDTVLYKHVGVRRYVFSIIALLKSNIRLLKIDYNTEVNDYFLSELHIDNSMLKSNFFLSSRLLASCKDDCRTNLYEAYQNSFNESYYKGVTQLPTSKSVLKEFSNVIWASPWVFKEFLVDKQDNQKFYCIAYDLIPNFYALQQPGNKGLGKFAFEHLKSYQIFLHSFDGLLSISNKTSDMLKKLFQKHEDKIYTLGTIIPAGFEDIEQDLSNKIERTILLASPLDTRKGLDIIPKYLNNLDYDKLIIFGRPRSSYDIIDDFFRNIKNENIEWWIDADYNKQIELYKEARVLIFPSHDEGLGLPVIESLCCGTPVFVSNIEPLNELVNKYFVLSDNLENDIKKIQNIINTNICINYPTEEKCRIFEETLYLIFNEKR